MLQVECPALQVLAAISLHPAQFAEHRTLLVPPTAPAPPFRDLQPSPGISGKGQWSKILFVPSRNPSLASGLLRINDGRSSLASWDFTVWTPCGQSPETCRRPRRILNGADPRSQKGAGKQSGAEVTPMSLKIMVVDDEPLSPKLIRSLAAPLDHTVLAFEDSQAAGQRAESQRFDVAFVGMGTPQLDGLELARRIRKSPLNLETTIVMLGATGDIGSLRKAFGEGADFVLTKPVGAGRIRQ